MYAFSFVCAECMKRRWALSVQTLMKHAKSGVMHMQGPGSVSLLNLDASKVNQYHFGSLPEAEVLMYCWDRGVGMGTFEHVVRTAAASPQVKGKGFYGIRTAVYHTTHGFCFILLLQALCVKETQNIPHLRRSQQSIAAERKT